jgi:hypothetical protein
MGRILTRHPHSKDSVTSESQSPSLRKILHGNLSVRINEKQVLTPGLFQSCAQSPAMAGIALSDDVDSRIPSCQPCQNCSRLITASIIDYKESCVVNDVEDILADFRHSRLNRTFFIICRHHHG